MTTLLTAITATAAIWVWVGLRELALDWFRQRLFEIRNRLWDRAAAGDGTAFDDPDYQRLREDINDTIQWAHLMGSARLAPRAIHMAWTRDRRPRRTQPSNPVAAAAAVEVVKLTAKYLLMRVPLLVATIIAIRFVAAVTRRGSSAIARAILVAGARGDEPTFAPSLAYVVVETAREFEASVMAAAA